MCMTDPVADLLTRIRNGSKANKPAIDVPASKLKKEVVRILQETKFIRDSIELPDRKQGILRIYLRYGKGDTAVVNGLQRISKPGLRKYYDAEKVRTTTHHMRGIIVISTSAGLMTNFDAAQKGIGGEALFRCW